MVCESCGKEDDTVWLRMCAYMEDIHGIEQEEQVCDACEREHIMDI